MNYRKKAVIIEAVQFDGTDKSVDWLLPQLKSGEIGRATKKLYIKTLKGTLEATIGDYIIKGINGEFYPCKSDIFEKTYELVEDEKLYRCPCCENLSTKTEIDNNTIKQCGADITMFGYVNNEEDYKDCFYPCPKCSEGIEGCEWEEE